MKNQTKKMHQLNNGKASLPDEVKTMTLREIIDLREGLRLIKGIKAREFAYLVEQNIVAITDALRGVIPQEEEIQELLASFNKEVFELCDKHRISLAKESDEVQRKDLEKVYEASYAILEEKYQKERSEFKQRTEELHKMYKSTPSEYKPIKFKFSLVPKDLSNEHFKALFPLIIKTEE